MKAGTHLRLDKTGKAILTVLRHLNRVQEVRVLPVCFQLQWVVAGRGRRCLGWRRSRSFRCASRACNTPPFL